MVVRPRLSGRMSTVRRLPTLGFTAIRVDDDIEVEVDTVAGDIYWVKLLAGRDTLQEAQIQHPRTQVTLTQIRWERLPFTVRVSATRGRLLRASADRRI